MDWLEYFFGFPLGIRPNFLELLLQGCFREGRTPWFSGLKMIFGTWTLSTINFPPSKTGAKNDGNFAIQRFQKKNQQKRPFSLGMAFCKKLPWFLIATNILQYVVCFCCFVGKRALFFKKDGRGWLMMCSFENQYYPQATNGFQPSRTSVSAVVFFRRR